MTDWWRTEYPQAQGESLLAVSNRTEEPTPPDPPPAAPPPVREEPEPTRQAGRPRGRTVRIVGGVAGIALIGALTVNATSAGGEEESPSVTPSEQVEAFPAAGGGPEIRPPVSNSPQKGSSTTPQGGVTLTATPSGKGRVGAVMKLSIHNSTDDSLTVLATLVEGDGRPAIVGEGTLAPGSTIIEPGETAIGTVEFSSDRPPEQVVLLDLSGDVVVTS